jgi:predicted ATPase/DNA-binding CsgD family transcriptional regulator
VLIRGGTGTLPRLPSGRSSFVGRRQELADVRGALGAERLVTLLGVGGVGKTRLAMAVVGEVERLFTDGVAVVELASVRDPALVAATVAAALDLRDSAGGWAAGQLGDLIGERRLLLVLDNCEQVNDAVGVLVDALLRWCPHLRVLATSRRALEVEGEVLFRVPPLAVPAPGTARGELVGYDAVRLLVERARASVPGYALSEAEVDDLVELCRRLDGVPLAIEMAAARLRVLTPAEVAGRLDDRFRLLRRNGVAVPERHRTLWSTMQWSYELLGEDEQRLWRRASVFQDGFDLAAAEAVCSDEELSPEEVLDGLVGLVDASLLDVVGRSGTSRFRMLETVRSFGQRMLDISGEAPAALRRHLGWAAAVGADAGARFLDPDQVAVFDRVAAVHAELVAALDRASRSPGLEPLGLRLACDLWLYWPARGHLTQARRLTRALLERCPPEAPEYRRGLAVAGFLALDGTDLDAATPLLDEALDRSVAAGDTATTAFARQYRGQVALFRGDATTARSWLRTAAQEHLLVDPRQAAFCLADVGVAALLEGSLDEAAEAFRESLRLNEGADPWTRSHALWGTSLVHLLRGETGPAREVAEESLHLMRSVDDRSGVALCVEALSWASAGTDPEHTARLAGAAEAVWRSIPAAPPGLVTAFRHRFTQSARDALGAEVWTRRFAQGAALDRVQATALALGEGSPEATAVGTPARSDNPLTPRQREVAVLVSEGLTDRQIAERLVISPRTAESHVEQILHRLGMRSRAGIAAWVARQEESERPRPRG